jgi:hypothetical protein
MFCKTSGKVEKTEQNSFQHQQDKGVVVMQVALIANLLKCFICATAHSA